MVRCRMLCMKGVMNLVIKLLALSRVLGCFVDGTAPSSTCSCTERINASVNLDGCKCYLLNYCMDEFMRNHDSTPAHDESMIDVAFFPFKKSFNHINYPPQPAYNITFQVNDERISGLAFALKDGCYPDAPKCRYFDFNSHKYSLKKAVFYTEEFFFQSPWGNSCTIEVKGLNNQLVPIYHNRFLTKVPDVDHLEQNCKSLLQWRSFVTLDQTSYKEESMRITFTTPPEHCNVTSFKLTLKENSKTKSWEIVEENTYMPNIHKLLHGIRPVGYYVVEVEINDENGTLCKGSCGISSSPLFSFQLEDSGFALIAVFIGAGVVFVILIVGLIWICCRKPIIKYDKVVTVYIAYSYDVELHRSVVKLFAEYLRQYCFCKVKLDIWDIGNEDPHFWVSESISNADFIFIIWSQGAKLKMCKKNTKVLRDEPGYLGNDLFSTAMTFIRSKIDTELRTPQYRRNLRKFVNICFPYVPSNAVPSQYEYLPLFHLPSNFNALLYHLHGSDQSPYPFYVLPSLMTSVSCCRCYPLMPFSNLKDTKEGNELIKAIEKMPKFKNNENEDWLISQPPECLEEGGCPNHSDYSEEDPIESATDTGSISSERSDDDMQDPKFPPPVRTAPIFGPGNVSSNAYRPAATQSPDSSPTCGYRMSHERFVNDRVDLPIDIFGPTQET